MLYEHLCGKEVEIESFHLHDVLLNVEKRTKKLKFINLNKI
jgi:hypothetical protein